MSLIEQLLAIARNTFFESIRQPVMTVVLGVAALLIILSNPFSAYTMQDDQRMLIDIGLSTIFISTSILAAFIATNVLTREIENQTALTVISKPVTRPVFVLGKYLGVAAALAMAVLFLSFVFLLVELHGVLPTVRTPYHLPVIIFGVLAMALGIAAAIWCNILYGMSFASSSLCITTPLLGIAYVISLLFAKDFTLQSIATDFDLNMVICLFMLTLAILVLTAIAIAASTRLGQLMTLSVTIGFFLVGLLSDWLFARRINELQAYFSRIDPGDMHMLDADHLVFYINKIAYAIIPNFQVFWLSDALTQGKDIPLGYIAITVPYGLLMIVAALSIAIILFQRREVG